MAPQTVDIPREYEVVGGHEVTLRDLERLQGFCNQCILRDNCAEAYSIDSALSGGAVPSFTERIAFVRKANSPRAEPHFICMDYLNATHAHK
jgi:hypothetical protein